MDVLEHPDARGFLAASAAYRAADPVRTNLLGSIAQGVVEGRRYDSTHWATVHADGRVVGAAVRTAPYSLVVGPMPTAAARVLGVHVRDSWGPLPGVNGPATPVDAVIGVMGRPSQVRMRDVLRELEVLVDPPPTAGESRRAVPEDVALIRTWHGYFLAEAGLPPHVPDDAAVLESLPRLWIWQVDGEPVAMAGHAPLVDAGQMTGRIGPVYTVPSARRRGIGAAVTAVVARHLQGQGVHSMLYADAANATSNALYERLGFRAVDEHVEVDLL